MIEAVPANRASWDDLAAVFGTRGAASQCFCQRYKVGWCAVEPRPRFTGLLRTSRVPREGRDEDKADESVWAVTCLFTRAGFRRRGVSRALAAAGLTQVSRPTKRRAVMRIDP